MVGQEGESVLKCFVDDATFELQDKVAFKLRHQLQGHPSLSLENMCRFIPALPQNHVYYSKGLLQTGDNFDRAPEDHPNGLSIEETIETMRTSNSYIMVRQPEVDPSFVEFQRDLIDDLKVLIKRRGWGDHVVNPKLYLFISSPNSVTPFHIDRASNFLMQIRGSKTVTVFPPWDERVVTAAETESRMAYEQNPLWKPQSEVLGTPFHFEPGDALHIPFVAGHHVKNGPEDVSISLSVFFNHRQTSERIRALLFNHRVRPALSKLGLAPTPVGQSAWRDSLKSQSFRAGAWLARGLGSSSAD